jgi:hypothetical protein
MENMEEHCIQSQEQGLYQLDRGAYKALGILNQFGDTHRATEIMGKMGVGQEALSNARNVYDKMKPSN